MISREEAFAIADEVRKERMLGQRVERVLAWHEITNPLPSIYLTGSISRDSLWIAYIEPLQLLGLHSSIIVAIDRETGEVVYQGSAGDEG